MKSELANLIFCLADAQARLYAINLKLELSEAAGEIICLQKDYEEAKAARDNHRSQLDTLCAKIESDLTTVWDDWDYRRKEEGGFN